MSMSGKRRTCLHTGPWYRTRRTHHEAGQAERNDDALLGEGGQVGGQLEVAPVVGQQHRVAHRGQRLDALDECRLLNAAVARPVQQVAALRSSQVMCS